MAASRGLNPKYEFKHGSFSGRKLQGMMLDEAEISQIDLKSR